MTSDAVAANLLTLAAAIATAANAEVIIVPVVDPGTGAESEAAVVVGMGTHLMSVPCHWDADEPDFSPAIAWMQLHPAFPYVSPVPVAEPERPRTLDWDPALRSFIDDF